MYDQGFVFLDYGDLFDDFNDFNDYLIFMEEVGVVNVIIFGLLFGIIIDVELDGQLDVMVDGEGVDDDGIIFFIFFVFGDFVVLNIKVVNIIGVDVVLEGWIDWNGNGSFDNDEYLEWYFDLVNFLIGGVIIFYMVLLVGMLDVNVVICVFDDVIFMNGMMLVCFCFNIIQV